MTPTVSVVILTWNSRDLVGAAIESALAQTVPPHEVIVYDNASEDGTAHEVARLFAGRVRLVSGTENTGYCGGYNRALRLATGDLLLLLNPDARLAPTFLECAVPAFADPRVGIVAPRVMRPDGTTVDSTGQFLARSRKTIDRGYSRPWNARRDRAGAVLAACGAVALYRRQMVDDIADDTALFDPDFFAFHEDLEVGWRAWRAGWRAVHVPEAVATHLRAGGQRGGGLGLAMQRSPVVLAHIVKNRILTSVRHDSLSAILVDLPFIVARDMAVYGVLLLRRREALRHLWHSRDAWTRARARRRADRGRSGVWGTWTKRVPPRGVW